MHRDPDDPTHQSRQSLSQSPIGVGKKLWITRSFGNYDVELSLQLNYWITEGDSPESQNYFWSRDSKTLSEALCVDMVGVRKEEEGA